MEKCLIYVSKEKDRLTNFKGNSRSSSISVKNSELIPSDLIVEILLRLPVKSIARFLCVSKDWATTLRSPYFTDLYETMSSSRPRLLFSLKTDEKWFFFSAPQPRNLDQNSSPLAADYHTCFPTITCYPYMSAPVHGLLCTKQIYVNHSKAMICNPSTGQFILTPTTMWRSKPDLIRTIFGFDPVTKQYKVLCMSVDLGFKKAANEHHVLTLGTTKLAWKMTECSLLHVPIRTDGICINGVLYYSAFQFGKNSVSYVIVCFDVRSEKFNFIKDVDNFCMWPWNMINYTGKLCVLRDQDVYGETTSLELWVLNDAEKNKWSHHIYVLPPSWKTLVVNTELLIVGITGNGDMVFAPKLLFKPLYIFFYNMEKNTVVRVQIQGIESTSRHQCIYTYIDHVEQVKRM